MQTAPFQIVHQKSEKNEQHFPLFSFLAIMTHVPGEPEKKFSLLKILSSKTTSQTCRKISWLQNDWKRPKKFDQLERPLLANNNAQWAFHLSKEL